MMKKPKRPKLVVDNKLPDEPTEEFTYEEFKVIADQLIELHKRYPELDALSKRARELGDDAMGMVCLDLFVRYGMFRDWIAEKKRRKLKLKCLTRSQR
jgi:hypothetical protein